MNLASLGFIFHFLPIFLIAYFVTPVRFRKYTLLAGSLVFYAMSGLVNIIILAGLTLINYLCLYGIQKFTRGRHLLLALGVTIDVATLILFKYFNTGIAIPLGLSFFNFAMLSSLIDSYNGKIAGTKFTDYLTYVTMFPQLISGPITRFTEIGSRFKRPIVVKPRFLEQGITLFALGLSYKVLLADKFMALWNNIYRVGPQGMDVATAWLGALGFSLEIYFDFAGYSMMAIGLGRILGFRLPDNFDDPYSTKTMTGFWRKWHMTLGRWFRDYVYIPLGGNRKGTARTIFNLFAVWMLTAIWHGPTLNFLVWGLFLFLFIFLEKYVYGSFLEKSKVLGHIYMMILIPISWTIFKITDVKLLFEYICRMFGIRLEGMAVSGFNKFVSLILENWGLIIIGLIFASPLPNYLLKRFFNNPVLKLVILALFWFSIYELITVGSNPFLYFAF